MKIAIVEDELLAANYLKGILESQDIVEISNISLLRSKRQAIDFFQNNEVDLIFMDIHLGDGKSLEIFEEVQLKTPLIFVTAYDEYALKVFKHFTLDYLLKPFEKEQVLLALHKFNSISETFNSDDTLRKISILDQNPHATVSRFLVHEGNQLLSIKDEEIAYFFASGKYLFITTNEGKTFIYEDTIKDIIGKINPQMFFKINRKYIVNIGAIAEVIKHSSQKIELKLSPSPDEKDVFVSKLQLQDWKLWMQH
ncbi:MAG: response regulator transcription factor [Bacteroidetes bacterium]|nr:response regulator transcription factor [Bacteroidota bacterium]